MGVPLDCLLGTSSRTPLASQTPSTHRLAYLPIRLYCLLSCMRASPLLACLPSHLHVLSVSVCLASHLKLRFLSCSCRCPGSRSHTLYLPVAVCVRLCSHRPFLSTCVLFMSSCFPFSVSSGLSFFHTCVIFLQFVLVFFTLVFFSSGLCWSFSTLVSLSGF